MIKIDNEFQNLIPEIAKEEFERLKENIKQEGIREPLIIWDNILIDGHNRFKISKELKIDFKTKEKKFKDRQEVLLWIINNQLARRNLSTYDKTLLALKFEEIINKKAKENQKAGGHNSKVGCQKSDKPLDTKKEIGKIANVSHDTVEKVKFIEKNATKEQKDKLSQQKTSINKVYHETRKKIIQKNNSKEIPLPKENCSIILADPPWRYDFSSTSERSIETHYSSMSLEQIKKMKIPSEKDSVLLLWATAPKLKEALEVMESWGFEYKSCAIWDKEIIGMGYWFRGQHELLLVGIKGKVKPPKEKDRISSVIKIKRKKHSEKPKEFYDIIEKMFPNEKYLELFARSKRKNWISWGNEVSKRTNCPL